MSKFEEYSKQIINRAEQDFVTGEDGFIMYCPSRNAGAHNAQVLRILADELDSRNEWWEEQVERDNG